MTKDAHLQRIYSALQAVSPYVRRSMLVFEAIPSVEQSAGGERSVLWMNEGHPLLPILIHNVREGRLGNDAFVHQATLAGMPVCGVYEDDLRRVIDLIWAEFQANSVAYPVYNEDGTPLARVNGLCGVLDATEHEVAPVDSDSEEHGVSFPHNDTVVMVDYAVALPVAEPLPNDGSKAKTE